MKYCVEDQDIEPNHIKRKGGIKSPPSVASLTDLLSSARRGHKVYLPPLLRGHTRSCRLHEDSSANISVANDA